MTVFLDTSAILALLDADEAVHAQAAASWSQTLGSRAVVATSNYVLLEASALIQRRFGHLALARFERDLRPALQTFWVDAPTHAAAVELLLSSQRRDLSLVDCVSFTIMQREGIQYALAFDRHFADRGYDHPPTPTE